MRTQTDDRKWKGFSYKENAIEFSRLNAAGRKLISLYAQTIESGTRNGWMEKEDKKMGCSKNRNKKKNAQST